MHESLLTSVASIFLAAISLALVAVLVSRNSNTSNVISASTSGVSNLIKAAVSPVSGGGFAGVSTLQTPIY